ncbi:hypothetical protein Hte_003093 [Hypoxylon texense]
MDGDIAIDIEMRELPLYRSVPLLSEPRSIRVLDLEASTEYNDPLVGGLRAISLDDCCPFTALSYTWGDPTTSHTLWLNKNGVSLEITKNCFKALRQLRHNYGAITIWVDAICINQADDREKEIQLPLMGEIYMWAEVVYVWLGTETKASLQALEALSRAASFNYLPIDPDRTSRNLPSWSEKARLALKLLPPYLNYGMVRKLIFNFRLTNAVEHQLVELLSRPWFSRAWTFQEIILASEAVFLCGPAAYRLDILARGVEFFNEPDPIASFSSYERTIANGARIPDQDMYHKTPYLGYSFPMEGEAFRRALQLWLSIERPTTTRNGRQVRKQLPSGQSFNDYQKPYANIHDFIIWNSVFGLYLNSLIAHGLLIAPFLLIVVLVVKATEALTYALICGLAAAFALIFMPLLPRRRPRKGYGSSQSKEDFVLEGLVQALRQRKAGVPKDRSYALYGILENLQLKLPQPDYRKSQGLVYHELFINLMRWRPAFVILLIDCGHSSEGRDAEMADAPTWVPDWNRLANDGAAMTETFLSMKRTINVIPGQSPYFRLNSNSRELVVRGQWVGCHIAYCTDKFEVQSLTPEEAFNNIALLNQPLVHIVEWISRAKSIKAESHSSSDWRKHPVASFWEYINGIGPGYDIPIKFFHETLTQRPLQSEQSESIERYQWSPFEAINKALYEAQGYSPSVAFEALMRVIHKDKRALWYIVEVIFGLSCNEGRLFVTSDGTVGCAYKHIQVNDQLALVAGVPAPLILRPHKTTSPPLPADGHEVVASAFVPEWNEGKALKKDQLEEIKLI